MTIPPRVLVVGNYLADQQQSMIRFAELLVRIYDPQAFVQLIRPPVLLGRLHCLPPIPRKYVAYIDKLLLFPLWLMLRARDFDLIHIADHGNAYYCFFGNPKKCIVTCHDLLMMRAVRGDQAVSCYPSPIGFLLQRLIMAGLRRASAVAFDSRATFNDFSYLVGRPSGQRHAVIPIPLNSPFVAESAALKLSEAELSILPPCPFLLMVGSAQPRKNRSLAIQLLEYLGCHSELRIVFAGAPMSPLEQEFRDCHSLGHRLLSVVRPTHTLLNWLYCHAHALLFPSFAEGFGWPLLEAQACDCPVIASNASCIPEVAGPAALYSDPNDVATFAIHVQSLYNLSERDRLIKLGRENLLRFDAGVISDAYRTFAFNSITPINPS